ncbi:glycosyltransferase [Streptomyces aureoverticillatus]|uniref:glycosyltransferase n=1 Tax=Streptomyces aureoverticillatus TaxID=66871 RepID=UPI0013DCE228|nr:glycosyltransferase [Streptomyces aureoverticillatus]QIB45975.1 glycosyltransferase [Streptomyces aureoverticillatus]
MLTSHLSPSSSASPSSSIGRVLAIGAPGPDREQLTRALESTGYEVDHAVPGDVHPHIRQAPPDAIVALDDGPGGRRCGGEVITEVRSEPAGQALPLVMVTAAAREPAAVADLLRRGADDCLPSGCAPVELSARIAAKLHRVPVPVDQLLRDPRTGLYSGPHFMDELDRELRRPPAARRGGVLAVVGVAEMPALEKRLGPRVHREVAERLAQVAERLGSVCDRLGWDDDGHLLVLMPGVDEETATRGLASFAASVAGTRFVVADENVRLTPAIGFTPLDAYESSAPQPHSPTQPQPQPRTQPPAREAAPGHDEAARRAREAIDEALRHRDLRPVRWEPWMRAKAADGPRHARARVGLSTLRSALTPLLSPVLMLLLGVGVPFLLYQQAYDQLGWDVAAYAYWVVVAGLVASALLIVLECFFSLDAEPRPKAAAQPYPAASAVIAAYLPNEAATIVDTVESFLRLEYPGELEIVLAYNTPHPLPVEDTLREVARRDPRLVLLPVAGSTSKAQNLNAAVTRVRGEFVGVFDADHHPAPDAFRHAWDWLSHGYDVVQGHCVVRNGDSSWVARMVAVEFEAIYAVSHPGRTRLYGFGVFGGSNGFWRTDVLARTRMHGSMLTEDIDSTMRALGAGARIAMDRTLISRELAPTMLRPLWNQRSRWAQGWLQVSLRHLRAALRSDRFTGRQKTGLFVLLGWREVQPWLTLQILPVLLHAAWRAGGADKLDWAVPVCLMAAAVTMSAGVVQAAFAWRLAVPELRRKKAWFWRYLLVTTVFYTHFKNLVARQAHLKEALGERQWRVTPRAAATADAEAS